MGSFMGDYQSISGEAAIVIADALSDSVRIKEVDYPAFFQYPTEQQIMMRSGGSADASSIKALTRIPELHLDKRSGQFKKGDKVCVLNRPGQPNFIMDQFYYGVGWFYRVTLIEDQEKPVDTAGWGWQ